MSPTTTAHQIASQINSNQSKSVPLNLYFCNAAVRLDHRRQLQYKHIKTSSSRAWKQITKVVTTPKKSGEQTWTWSGAGFTRQTPSEKQTAAPESSLLYKRARYYDPNTGEFVSRDPLGFVDGMSLYRAYFVPGAMDPSGRFLELLKAAGGVSGSVTIPLFGPWSFNVDISGSFSGGTCCKDGKELRFNVVKAEAEGYFQVGKSFGKKKPPSKKGEKRDRPHHRIPHPCKPGQVVKRSEYNKIKARDCRFTPDKPEQGGDFGPGGGIEGTTKSVDACPNDGKDGFTYFDGSFFARAQAGAYFGGYAEVEKSLDANFRLEDFQLNLGVGYTGSYGVSIDVGLKIESNYTWYQGETGNSCCGN